MGIVTTHTEGRVVTHAGDGELPVEVVQLPARDAAVQAAASPAAPAATPAKATPAVQAAVAQQRKRLNTAPKAKAMPTTKGRKPKR